jgi:hypothetical protein
MMLVGAAVLVAGAAVWVSGRSRSERPAGDPSVLPALADSLDSVSEVRLSRGDGAATTLQRSDNGWIVAQRKYPADPGKLRTLLLQLSTLRIVEQKTGDPSHYAVLNVEDPAGAQSHSVKIDVVAGPRTWSLLLGKPGEPSGSYVRVPGAGPALLAQPRVEADPTASRWIDASLIDVAAARIEQVTVKPATGPSYSVAREARGAADLTLHGAPAGRKPAGTAVVNAVAGALARLNADDVKERPAVAPEHPSLASFRTFDGLQLDVDGYREGSSTWIRINARVDRAAAKRFAQPQAVAAEAKVAEAKGADTKGSEKPADPAAEAAALNARLQGFDFLIPAYRYDELYRQLKDLLAAPAGGTIGASGKR